MSHTIYTTESFILKSAAFGEANKYYFIFTKEFGLIKAAAQGVRHLKSKLRYGLMDYSFCQVSVVRGKEIWRLTSAEKKGEVKNNNLSLLVRIFSLLLRLLHGEEKNIFLFDCLKQGFDFLAKDELLAERAGDFECIMALRILSALGYVGNLSGFESFVSSPYFTPELLAGMSILKTRAILEINKSLKETHL